MVGQLLELQAFNKFSEVLSQVTAAQPDMPTADVVAMYSSLMAFAIQARGQPRRNPREALIAAGAQRGSKERPLTFSVN